MAMNDIFSWIIKKRIHQIELFKKYPFEVQEEWFWRLIESGAQTEFGKKHDFESIDSYEDFAENVPLQDYNSLKPFVDRMLEGEQNLLWNSKIKWFAKSSGTTAARSKFIPVSAESLQDCHYKGGKDLLGIYYSLYPEANLYGGQNLIVGGSSAPTPLGDESYFGDLSAIIVNNLPFWVEQKRTPAKEIALMDNWENKVDEIAKNTMHQDVTLVSGVPSWTLVIFNRILELTGKKNMHEVWPNLELFMHGGVNFEPYRSSFEALCPGRMNYMESYNASEGFFGIQDQKEAGNLLLMLDYGIFYEFIPMNQFEGVNSKVVHQLEEVELGVNYALVISTNAGLWRYIIGDTIMFTEKNPYRFKLTGRTSHFINAFGEELIVSNSDMAIAEACRLSNSIIRDYTAAPLYMDANALGGRHEWLVEFEKEPDNLDFFTEKLDENLKRINTDYEAKRTSDLALAMPLVRKLPQGTFENWLRNKGKLGGQHKVPRLSNNRTFIDEILELCSVKV